MIFFFLFVINKTINKHKDYNIKDNHVIPTSHFRLLSYIYKDDDICEDHHNWSPRRPEPPVSLVLLV